MNYRHAYHAGNFADVMKHALLTRILHHLKQKDTPFRYLETHAGIGFYDLKSDEALRTGEAERGVRRFLTATCPPPIAALFQPYMDVLRATAAHVKPVYPGSPMIAAQMLRPQDKLTIAELHEEDYKALISRFHKDERIKIHHMDGWQGLRAWLPPTERRGVVLVDPPFEDKREFHTMADACIAAHRKWATGIFALWYPVKSRREVEDFLKVLKASGIPKILRLELRYEMETPGLAGSGLIVINPPWKLMEEARHMLGFLARALAEARPGFTTVEWIAGEA